MFPDDRSFWQSFRSGCSDVILSYHLQHIRSGEAGEKGEASVDHASNRQNEMPGDIANPSEPRKIFCAIGNISDNREPVETVSICKEHNEDSRYPKGRERVENEKIHHDRFVEK